MSEPERRDYGRWHDWIGYGLLVNVLAIATYCAFAGEWVGLGLDLGVIAFVLWTIRRAS